ncbi:hypothetical protein BDW22DRAFT_1336368 [Trametopsis cervina]|nr:hypothetical protein BDW22DRAFT_1336368 [Trametopsis cervina]
MNPELKRNSLSPHPHPHGSLSRAHGSALLQRTGSHESLTAHPLLSPTLAAPSTSTSTDQAPISTSTASAPRYVPYTPRQRAAPASTASGVTIQPAPGDATSKLQLMNLKAAAQRGGLDTASTGWAILEKLGTEADRGEEWNRIWDAIARSKATLLLPLEAHPAHETITPEFLKDHVVFWDGAHRDAPAVTLSGLRGTMAEYTLIIRSTLDPSSKVFHAIQDPTTRPSAFNALPPLPATLPHLQLPLSNNPSPSSSSSSSSPLPLPLPTSPNPAPPPPPESPYPTYSLTSHHPSLPLPPRPPPTSGSKPPLPPRPRTTAGSTTAAGAAATSTPAATASRLSNPFASLFGRASTPAPQTPPASPQTALTPLHGAASDVQSSSSSVNAADGGTEHALGVPAFTISRRIVRREVARALLTGVRRDVGATLAASGAPTWVAERVEEFAERERLLPFIKSSARAKGRQHEDAGGGGYVVAAGWDEEESMDDVGRRVQGLYADVEALLVKRKWKGGRTSGLEEELDTEKESEAEEHAHPEEDERTKRIREVVEAVERALCTVFYDRLFLQGCSDDATHDEALSSRIAAVNLLDLSLAHLGVDVGESATAVEAVVKACGETLSQLDAACRAPADKAAVLVAAHKILVDGLSRLPPIKLKPEDELLDDKTPRAHTFGRSTSDEEDDDNDDDLRDAHGVLSPGLLHDSPTVVLSPKSTRPQEDDTDSANVEAPEAAPARSTSPRLTISPAPPTTPTPVSGDIILPLMIFAAVKANPPHLVSHLLYTQRFRNQTVGGEESYCLINLMAVAEFLENVDLAALGLGESEKNVISTAELTPITVTRPGSEPASPRSVQASLRGRVEQQVDAIAGSANKVISGVVDTSFGVLRAFLPGAAQANTDAPAADPDLQESAPWNATRPGFGLLRRDTAFSIASLAASLPGAGIRAKTPVQKDEDGQPLLEVPSRPASVRSSRRADSEDEDDEDEDDEDDEDEEDEDGNGEEHDARSIRSFESMMNSRSGRRKRRLPNGRKSITDRLASVTGLSRLSHPQAAETSKASPPASRRSSLLIPPQAMTRYDSPMSSRAASPVGIRISPPNARFLECSEDDIKVSEVAELLREYKRMVEAVRAMGGFHE